MSDRARNIFNMFVGTIEFDRVNSDDYKHLPDAELKFAIVRDVVANLEEHFSDQLSGAVGKAVDQKNVLVAAAKRRMKEYSGAARALNIDDPGFRRLFSIPNSNSPLIVTAAGREFIEEITKHAAEFERFGLLAADLAVLTADINAIEAAVSAKAGANMKATGATAGIDDEIGRGMDAEIFLDAMMRVIYRTDPVKLQQWKPARHVRRANVPTPPKPDEPPSE
ncbi:MAG TPA: hypothetical protein PKY59_13695 [Pyrinomonadaceae bacterium]|nr:hypothetical protein [Pyrinomonadaceae bacterium]